jgi:hypothetical protein
MAGLIGFGLKFSDAKKMFFDRQQVQSIFTRKEKRVLSQFGAYVRQRAKSSIRKSRKGEISQPGRPPKSHTGLLKKFIFFSADTSRRSVVIGPTALPAREAIAPPALEVGGTSEVTEPGSGAGVRRRRRVWIRPRPFMEPAFREELPKVNDLWASA